MASKRTNMTRYPYEPDYAVPPGWTLQETIDKLGITKCELAVRSGLAVKHINRVIQGIAAITPGTAILLERVTGVPARVWNYSMGRDDARMTEPLTFADSGPTD